MAISLMPTDADIRTNASFEEIMWALSRPGLPRKLPADGLHAAAECLLDRECSYNADLYPALEDALKRTGARKAALREADYVFACADADVDVAQFSHLKIGNLVDPDKSASLLIPARFGEGQSLRLTGPGIKDELVIQVGGIAQEFWQMRQNAIRYPLGWDLYLFDGDTLVGLPRSTHIEVL